MIDPLDSLVPWIPANGEALNLEQRFHFDTLERMIHRRIGGKTLIRAQMTRKAGENAGYINLPDAYLPWVCLTDKGRNLLRKMGT